MIDFEGAKLGIIPDLYKNSATYLLLTIPVYCIFMPFPNTKF